MKHRQLTKSMVIKIKIAMWLGLGLIGYLQLALLVLFMPVTRPWSFLESTLVILCISVAAALVSLGFCKIIDSI
jgi:hypothetical protein